MARRLNGFRGPRGQLLAFSALISVIAPALFGPPAGEAAPDDSSPTEYTLVLSSDRGNGTMDLYLHTLGSAEWRPVATDPNSLYGPSWAPDGSRILFTQEAGGDSEVYAVAPDGSGRTNLTNREGYDGNGSYSPDGRTIVFVSTRDALAEGHAGRDLWLMDADGSNVRALTRNAMYEGGPRFSPDGARIAFCRQISIDEETRDGEIFVIDRDGGNEVRITTEPGFDCLPDWSPDGQMLAFHGCREDGCFIFVSRSDGSDLRRVTNDEYGGQWPRWSPDGKWIAYTSARDDQTDIWLARPDGSETRRVTDHPGRDEVADWQP